MHIQHYLLLCPSQGKCFSYSGTYSREELGGETDKLVKLASSGPQADFEMR